MVGKTVRRGTLADELFAEDVNGDTAFVLKDVDGGLNTCNVAWTSWETWENSHPTVQMGTIEEYDGID